LDNPAYAIETYIQTFDKTQEGFVPFKLFVRQKEISTIWRNRSVETKTNSNQLIFSSSLNPSSRREIFKTNVPPPLSPHQTKNPIVFLEKIHRCFDLSFHNFVIFFGYFRFFWRNR
jgi:hypothetical protein